MNKETKEKALEKLDGITANVGYPDWLFKNDELEKKYHLLKKDDLSEEADFFDLSINLSEGKTIDSFKFSRKLVNSSQEWPISPVLTNATYFPFENTITIPISMLRGFFFSKEFHKYMNYAQLGSIIGHELTHAFDSTKS